MNTLSFIVTLSAAIGCGLMAGLLFAFSAFVIKALARLPVAEGIAAMQSINAAVFNPLFGVAFLGTATACLLTMIFSLLRGNYLDTVYVLVGSGLYLVGTFLLTILYHVPKNEALAVVTPADPDSADLWADYLVTWTTWNHVRTVAALTAAVLLTIAL